MKSSIDYRRLDEVCIKITDGAHWSPKGVENGYPMASVKDMEDNGFSFKDIKYVSKDDYEKLVKSDCKPLLNDVLIAKDGSFLKHVFVCKKEIDMVILSSIAILRPDVKYITPTYLRYVLKSPYINNVMANFATGSALQRIVLSDFKKVKIPVPTIKEQKKLESILLNYDRLIESNNKRIDLLEKIAHEIYKEWFIRMRFPGYEKVKFDKGIPEGWKVSILGELIECKNGKEIEIEISVEGPYTVFGSNGIIGKSKCHNVNDAVIIGRVGAYCGSINVVFEKSWATDNTIIVTPKDKEMELFYLVHLLNNVNLRNYAGGSAQPLLTQGIINKVKVLLPKSTIIYKFNSLVKPLVEQKLKLEQKNLILKKTRDLLLPRLMSGKLSVE